MASNEIWHEVRIKASPGAVYQALTEVKKLAQWWIPDTRGEARIGKIPEFWIGASFCQTMRVTALEPDKLVRWQAAEGLSDWAGTEVEFKIIPHDGRSHLKFRHAGWRSNVEGFPLLFHELGHLPGEPQGALGERERSSISQ